MAKSRKPRTPEQQLRDTDRRLQRTYGITLDAYNDRLASQGGGCAICGKGPATKRLHTDHCHKFAKEFRILRKKLADGTYHAETQHKTDPLRRFYIGFVAGSKTAAVAQVRQALKMHSVRGILCFHCNRGLRLFFDRPASLERAAQYLRAFTERSR